MYKFGLRILPSLSALALLSSTAMAGEVVITSSPSTYGVGDNVIVFDIHLRKEPDSFGNYEEIYSYNIKKPSEVDFEQLDVTNCINISTSQFKCNYNHIISDAERGAPIEITVKADFYNSNLSGSTEVSKIKSVELNADPVAVITASSTIIYNNQLNAPTAISTHLDASGSYDGQGGLLTYEWRESGTSYYPSSILPSTQNVISIPAPQVSSPPQIVNIELVATDSDGNVSVPAIQTLNVLPNVCSYWDNTNFQSLLKFSSTSGNAVSMALDDTHLFGLMSSSLANLTSINPNTQGLKDIVQVQGLGPTNGFSAILDSSGQALKNASFPYNVLDPNDLTGALTIGQIYTIASHIVPTNSASQNVMNPTNCSKAEISFRVPPYSFSSDLKRPIEFLQNGVVIDTIRIPYRLTNHGGISATDIPVRQANPNIHDFGDLSQRRLETTPNIVSPQVIKPPKAILTSPVVVSPPKTITRIEPAKKPVIQRIEKR